VNDPRLRWLAFVALFLAVIRFFLLPLIEFRSELRNETEVLTRRLDRSEAVLKNSSQIKEIESKLEQSFVSTQALIPRFDGVEPFRLSTQQSVALVVTETATSLTLFDWAFEDAVPSSKLRFSRARIIISGEMSSIARLQSIIGSRFPNAVVREWSVVPEGEAKRAQAIKASLTSTIDFYYLPIKAD
jgi:hypothetical protein